MAYQEKSFGKQLVDEFKLGFKLGVYQIIEEKTEKLVSDALEGMFEHFKNKQNSEQKK